MDYNTDRSKLKMPEYGRYIQECVEHLKRIPGREERTRAANAVMAMMARTNPAQMPAADLKRKMWDHLVILADYDIDVDSPFPMPDRKLLEERPQPLGYDKTPIARRHYGKLNERMARKIGEFQGEEREALAQLVANTMKRSYLSWNKNEVDDTIIIRDLREAMGGDCELPAGLQLSDTRTLQASRRAAQPQHNAAQGRQQQQGKGKYRRYVKKNK